jgi:hypothetical protein
MAEPEVQAAWRAELERIGEKQRSDTPVSGNASKKQMVLDWLGAEVETQRLRQEHTHHYLRRTLFAAKPCPDETLKIWPVDRIVGNVRNKGPQLAMPISPSMKRINCAGSRLTWQSCRS